MQYKNILLALLIPVFSHAAPNYHSEIENMIDANFYFASIPALKEQLLESKTVSKRLNANIEKVIFKTGISSFESLPENVLIKSKTDAISFILAKKKFNIGDYKAALGHLRYIDNGHHLNPYATFLKASIYAIEGNYDMAISLYSSCSKMSASTRQLEINRDYCIIGKARALYAKRDFLKSELAYLDLPKSSYIWPEILFEEAWNSYYKADYNRTLGKLVTYKSPFLDYIYNPEVDVLNALSYFRLCLWNDAKLSVDNFYAKYMEPARKVRESLLKYKTNFAHYFTLANNIKNRHSTNNSLYDDMIRSVTREAAYLEMIDSLQKAIEESKRIKNLSVSNRKRSMLINISEVVTHQRDLVGAYVRKRLVAKYAQLYRAFVDMSYIKLEVLAQRKKELYRPVSKDGKKRGDLKYVKRNDKQYFWNFNGEFWADELGDYVFALKSECN